MKKINLFGVAIMLLSATSCNDEELFNEQPSNVTISASMEGVANTRSNATDAGTFTWEQGDKIAVYTSKGAFKEFTLNGTGGDAVANFKGTLDAGETISKYAVYPYNSTNPHTLNGDELTFNFPDSYGDFGTPYTANTNAAMVAVIDEKNPTDIEFKHLGGVLRFNLNNVPKDAAQFVFTATDKDITGAFTVDLNMTNPLPEISANTLSTKNSVTIKFQPLAEETNGMTFFVPMPTETYNGFSITIKDKDGKTLSSYTTGTTNTLKRHDLALYTDLELTNGYYVKLKEAGTLASILGDDMLNIKALKITGPLNGDDIKTLRQMLATPEFNDLLKGNLNILDLSEAIIVAGGRSYNESYTTVDNEIGKYMFRNAYNLREIILPNSVTAIRGDALACCYYLTKVTIGDNVTTIGWDAFNGCNITSIIIPNSVIEIEPFAFSYCELLTNLTIGNSVTTIGWNAFQYCSSLTNVTIPNSVTTIGEEAFEGCSKLTEVTCHATTPPTLGSEAFIVAIALRVPKGTKSLYEATDWKNYFVNIVESSE